MWETSPERKRSPGLDGGGLGGGWGGGVGVTEVAQVEDTGDGDEGELEGASATKAGWREERLVHYKEKKVRNEVEASVLLAKQLVLVARQ